MTWLALTALLAASPYMTSTAVVFLDCVGPEEQFYIIANGDDFPQKLIFDKEHGYFTASVPRLRAADEWVASLHLGGARTDCQKADPASNEKAAIFKFHCDQRPADNVIITVTTTGDPSPEVAYDRRLNGKKPAMCDCLESERVDGKRTIYDLRRDEEKLILRFGAKAEGAPGVDVRGYLLARRKGATKWDGLSLPKAIRSRKELQRDLNVQRAQATGYLAPIGCCLVRHHRGRARPDLRPRRLSGSSAA